MIADSAFLNFAGRSKPGTKFINWDARQRSAARDLGKQVMAEREAAAAAVEERVTSDE